VPYATGEIPEVGDYVKNQWGQLGTVTRVHEEERICTRWDDGGLELLFSPASEYTLVFSLLFSPETFELARGALCAKKRPSIISSILNHINALCLVKQWQLNGTNFGCFLKSSLTQTISRRRTRIEVKYRWVRATIFGRRGALTLLPSAVFVEESFRATAQLPLIHHPALNLW
jgi:hypothetical protein